MALRHRTLRAAAIGATMLAATAIGCGQRGYERPRTALNFQPGYPPGYTATASQLLAPAAHQSHAGPPPAPHSLPAPGGGPTPPPRIAPAPSVPDQAQAPGSYRAALRGLRPTDPAMRIANLSPEACRAEVAARKLPVVWHHQGEPGVASPLRLSGPLRGVRFVTHPAPSSFGLMDCRMALALDELAVVLARFDVVEARIDNVYRKGARIGGGGKPSQHAHALAADITALTRAGGQRVEVENNWGAPIGTTPCGPEAVMVDGTAHSSWLRDLVCEVARRGIFHHLLTPSFDAAHRNHFHFDIQRDRRSLYLR